MKTTTKRQASNKTTKRKGRKRPASGRGMQANNAEQLKKAMIEAMRNSLGIVSTACDRVGISRTTFYEYYNNDAQFKADIDSIEDYVIDRVESRLHTNIKLGDVTSIIFYLKTKGRKRGYVEKHTIDLTSGDRELMSLTGRELDGKIKDLETKVNGGPANA